ncbi:MAG: hypothetical protein AB1423_12410 [Pseudomonadota bacterium]
MTDEGVKILIWFGMSIVGILFFLVAFRGEMKRATAMSIQARQNYDSVGGFRHSLDIAMGGNPPITHDLQEAKDRLTKCESRFKSIKKQRNISLIATPAIIAFVVIFLV